MPTRPTIAISSANTPVTNAARTTSDHQPLGAGGGGAGGAMTTTVFTASFNAEPSSRVLLKLLANRRRMYLSGRSVGRGLAGILPQRRWGPGRGTGPPP